MLCDAGPLSSSYALLYRLVMAKAEASLLNYCEEW